MALQSKLEELREQLEQKKSALSDADRAEIQEREQLKELRAAIAEEDRKARELDLDRRMDRARAALGDGVELRAISVIGFPDTFIARPDPIGYKLWTNATEQAASKLARSGVADPADRERRNRELGITVVYDWNGELSGKPEFTNRLDAYLTSNPGIVSPLTDAAVELAGVLAETRKS